MKSGVAYKGYLIQSESFQREKNGTWVPQYAWKRLEVGGKAEASSFPTDQYQFHVAFTTEIEADEYALSRAKEWIDGR